MKQYLTASQLSKYFGDTLVFENASFSIHEKWRVALIGPNGTGKTTFLKIVAGLDTSDSGSIHYPNNLRIGYVDQHATFTENETIYNIMLAEIAESQEIFERIRGLEIAFGNVDYASEAFQKISTQYEALQDEAREKGLYLQETKIKMLLTKLGFPETVWNKNVQELSGGQQVRLQLARVLLQEPELLLLDEPTNHLDIETIIWLNKYLMSYPHAIIFITHDEKFIATLATHIWQFINHSLLTYSGTYNNFKKQLAEQANFLEAQAEKTLKEKQKLQEFVDRNRTRSSTAKRAQSAQKRLNKIADVQTIQIKNSLKPFALPIKRQSGKFVFKIQNAEIGYTHPLYTPLSTDMLRYERIALVGKNGIGKSTLLNTLAGRILPLAGSVERGHHVDIAYFEQQQVFAKENQSIFSTFADVYPDANRDIIYPILARFGFSQEDVQLINTNLSGGEKQRLLLALMYYQKANTLLLDEPTNHLDIVSKQSLITSFHKFDGTIIFASHDREFIEQLATRIFFFHEGKVFEFSTYIDFENFSLSLENEPTVNTKKTQVVLDRAEQKRLQNQIRTTKNEIEKSEKTIEVLEAKIIEIDAALFLEENYSDYQKAARLQQEKTQAQADLQAAYQTWEEQHIILETLENQ